MVLQHLTSSIIIAKMTRVVNYEPNFDHQSLLPKEFEYCLTGHEQGNAEGPFPSIAR
uniref:Uncharacterized protein n=1 Tax=Arundo donax TaxID=35708 RepID=A0A0A9BWT6_ARUDO